MDWISEISFAFLVVPLVLDMIAYILVFWNTWMVNVISWNMNRRRWNSQVHSVLLPRT